MQPDVKAALVLGGTGVVGSAVLRELARRGIAAVFTYHRSEDKARGLELELGHRAVRVDLADAAATVAMLEALGPRCAPPRPRSAGGPRRSSSSPRSSSCRRCRCTC